MPNNKLLQQGYKNGFGYFKGLFYNKLIMFSDMDKTKEGWNNRIPLKFVNRKFSLLFLKKEETRKILAVLESEGMVEVINKKTVVLKGGVKNE